MGCNSSKERLGDLKEGVKEVVEELPEHLKPAETNEMSVTLTGYDPEKTPHENAEYHGDRKPINEKVHHVLKNKYPQEGLTLGPVDPDTIKKDKSDAM